MFTGIVEETSEIVEVSDSDRQCASEASSGERSDPQAGPAGRRLRVAASFSDGLEHGQSVAVSGACLTVEDRDAESFELFCSEETLERTYLDALEVGDGVNLERALPADGRFDGHFVQGHVDGVGEVTEIERVGDGAASGEGREVSRTTRAAEPRDDEASGASPDGDASGGDWYFGFSLPDELARYVVEKGSIAVDGISLTVADLRDESGAFVVAVIPATHELTTLSEKRVGDPVHLEVDVVAKYVESLVEGYA
jgi:riboflavin synthase